jgi:hypothetical protein
LFCDKLPFWQPALLYEFIKAVNTVHTISSFFFNE